MRLITIAIYCIASFIAGYGHAYVAMSDNRSVQACESDCEPVDGTEALCSTDTECERLCPVTDKDCDGGPQDQYPAGYFDDTGKCQLCHGTHFGKDAT